MSHSGPSSAAPLPNRNSAKIVARNSGGSVGRASALMSSGTLVSRVLGALRGVVLAAAIGATGQVADAFSVANKLPNILYLLLAGGALNAVLVPQVVRAYRRHVGQEYVDRLLTFGFTVLAGITVVLTIGSPLLVRLYADPCSQAQVALATTFAYWCVPEMFFYGAYALLGQVLNARGSFGPYMWAPVVNNIVSIAGFGLFIVMFGHSGGDASTWGAGKIFLLAGTATFGIVTQAAVLLPALRLTGVHFTLRWGLRGSGLGRAGTVAIWTFLGLAVGQLGYIVVSRVASAAPGAAGVAVGLCDTAHTGIAGNAAYDYAYQVFMLPHSLITTSLITALFTRMAGQAASGDKPAVRASLSTGLRAIALTTIFAAALVGVLAYPVVRLFLWTSQPDEIAAVGGVVIAMVIGLPAFGAWSMFQRVYYAYEDARAMVPVQIVMAVVVVVGTLLARAVVPPRWWVAGAGLAMSISYLIGALLAVPAMRRRIDSIDGPRVVRVHVQAAVAAVVSIVVGEIVLHPLGASPAVGVIGSLLRCAVVGFVMTAVYGFCLRAMHVRELDMVMGSVRSVVRRFIPEPATPRHAANMSNGRAVRATSARATVGTVERVARSTAWQTPAPAVPQGRGGQVDNVVGRGTVLASRYRLTDPLPCALTGVTQWSAMDQILVRPVMVRVFAASGAGPALDAARRAALVADPRLVRVLDVGSDEGVGYVVTEQTTGSTLAELVAREPLSADQARAVIGEAATALEVARRRGVHHLALRPSAVAVSDDGRVLVLGLAVDASLLSRVGGDAHMTSRTDATDLVRLIYTALTGRWPGPVAAADGLPTAPEENGVPVPPLALVPTVPADLNTLCVATLGRQDDGPLSPADLVGELEPWGEIHVQGRPRLPVPPVAAVSAAAGTAANSGHVTRQSVRDAFVAPAGTAGRPATWPPVSTVPQPPAPHPLAALGTATPGAGIPTAGQGPARPPAPQSQAIPAGPSFSTVAPPFPEPMARPAATAGTATAGPAAAAPAPASRRRQPPAVPPAASSATSLRNADTAPLFDSASASLFDAASGTPGGTDAFGFGQEDDEPPRRRAGSLVAIALVAILVIVAIALAAKSLVAGHHSPATSAPVASVTAVVTPGATTPATANPSVTASPTPTAVPGAVPTIASIQTISPTGTDGEHQELIGKAFDGDPSTYWSTYTYKSAAFSNMKPAVGLALTLSETATVHTVTLHVNGTGGNVEVRTGDALKPGTGTLLASGPMSADTVLTLSSPQTTSSLVIWFTQLPTTPAGQYCVQLTEIELG